MLRDEVFDVRLVLPLNPCEIAAESLLEVGQAAFADPLRVDKLEVSAEAMRLFLDEESKQRPALRVTEQNRLGVAATQPAILGDQVAKGQQRLFGARRVRKATQAHRGDLANALPAAVGSRRAVARRPFGAPAGYISLALDPSRVHGLLACTRMHAGA